jgi:hypothetical protein
MLQTTTNAPKARSFFCKYYPPLGNRTAHRRSGRVCEGAPTLVVLLSGSVKRRAAQEVSNERPSVQRRFPFSRPGHT